METAEAACATILYRIPACCRHQIGSQTLVITIYELVPGPARACAGSLVNVCSSSIWPIST